MAPEVGFEPTANRLTAGRSTTELLGNAGSDSNIEYISSQGEGSDLG